MATVARSMRLLTSVGSNRNDSHDERLSEVLRVQRRIEKIERAWGWSHRSRPFVHRINFMEGDGTVTGTVVFSGDPKLCEEYRDILPQSPKEAE
jgi:hypothetical protein